jgi:hypothetical protein
METQTPKQTKLTKTMNKSGGLKTNSRFESLKSSAPSDNSFSRPSSRYGRDEPSKQTQGSYASQSRGSYASQSQGAYAPKSRNTSGSNSFFAVKKEPKKEFLSKDEMFPTFQQAEIKKKSTEMSTLDFTSAVKRKKKTKKKWEGTRMEAKPGYVVLYYDECGRMQRVYGEGASETNEAPVPNRAVILNAMVARWQERRDYLNETHGCLSPYYGQKSLLEEPDEDCFDNWGDNGSDVDGEPEDDFDGDY